MKNSKQISVAHLWGDYYVNSDGNHNSYIKSKKHKSAIIAAKIITDGDTLPPDIYANSIKKIGTNSTISLYSRIKDRLLRYFFWQNVNNWAIKQVKAINPNILHVHFGFTAVRMLPVIKNSKLPVVITFYGVDGSSMIADPKWAEKYKQAFKYVSCIIVLSETVKERIIQLGFEKDKIFVWNIPIKLNTYIYRKKQRSSVIKFITAARFVEKKGYPYLIAAFKKVNTLNTNTTLTIIGYGSGKDKIEFEIKKHDLEDKITVIDTHLRTDFHQFYYEQLCEHDIFVLPSTTSKNGDDEGGPALTLVAAQASGLPVICTPFVGSEISVFNNKTGVLCNQDDVDSIAEKMITLIEDPEFCDKIGKAASELVHPLFTEDTQMKILLDIYCNLLK